METNDKIQLSGLLYATKREQGGYDVIHHNGVHCGTLEPSDDGYLYYFPPNRCGCWSSHEMREIASLIDYVNEKWDDQVQLFF